MTTEDARVWIIKLSLCASLGLLLFFLLAPSLGYPLKYDKAFQLLGTVLPVFTGYVGAAAHFIFRPNLQPASLRPGNEKLLKILTFGPIVLVVVAMAAILFAFAYSNRISAASLGTGMPVELLGIGLSIILGVLTISTSAIVSYLFAADLGVRK